MILLCGISSETPLRLVERRLDEAGANYVMLQQRNFESCQITFEVSRGTVSGRLRMGTQSYRLEDFTAVYTRLMDDRCLPELANQPEGSPLRVYCRGFHDALTRWTELTQGLVINRVIPMGSNSSKPYQAQLIRAEGFLVPETLVTSNPDAVREFREKQGRVIYKSVSVVRSIVQTLEDADLDRLDHIRWCPTQFQALSRAPTCACTWWASASNLPP